MSEKRYKQFNYGKNLPKSAKRSKPMQWIPFSYIDTYNIINGLFRSRRKYGKDGRAYKDMDTADTHRPYDHIHEIHNGVRSLTSRKPNYYEEKELTKAKRKRRFYNDWF